MYPTELKYTKEHEWARADGDIVTIGITYYAQDELGDIVYVELPEVGAEIEQLTEYGVVESVKTVSQLYAPVTGKVIEVNKNLIKNSSLINDSPYEDGWMIKIEASDTNEIDDLLTVDEYQKLLEEQ